MMYTTKCKISSQITLYSSIYKNEKSEKLYREYSTL
jgi:hypothetical protein